MTKTAYTLVGPRCKYDLENWYLLFNFRKKNIVKQRRPFDYHESYNTSTCVMSVELLAHQ